MYCAKYLYEYVIGHAKQNIINLIVISPMAYFRPWRHATSVDLIRWKAYFRPPPPNTWTSIDKISECPIFYALTIVFGLIAH